MISATRSGGNVTLTIRGKFNFSCYQEFHAEVGRDVAEQYFVDMRDVSYIDSAALGMLLLLRERVGEDSKRVTLQIGAGQPKDVLGLANFGSLFTFA